MIGRQRGVVPVLLFLLSLVFQLGACASAPRPPAAEIKKAPAQRKEPVFLWEVRGETGGSAYLLGSIHVRRSELPALDPAIEDAYESAAALVVEVNMQEVSQQDLAQAVAAVGMLPEGQTLRERLAPRTYELLDAELARMHMPLLYVNRLQPWLAAITVLLQQLKTLGYDPEHGIDRYFLDRAGGRKPIVALESADFQLRLFAGFPAAVQELLLLDALRGPAELRRQMEAMTGAWERGDAGALEQAAFLPLKENPALSPLYERLFFQRNRAMAAAIERRLADPEGRPSFVVVGAGHLVGERGIVELLRKKGHSVRQVLSRREP